MAVKLTHKSTYKVHNEYQFVDTLRVKQAFQFLKQTNSHYNNIVFNEAYFCREQEAEILGNDNSADRCS